MNKTKIANREPETHEEDYRDDASIARAFWISLGVIIAVGLIAAAAFGAYHLLNQTEEQVNLGDSKVADKRQIDELIIPRVKFADITDQAGIVFEHVNGALGEKLLPETMGGGVAFIDYDNDGDQDLFFVNSDYWPGEKPETASQPQMALFSNDGTGNFTDVTEQVGLDKSFFGMGVAVGDYDNDGWRDLYVSAVGTNHLFRNLQGKFEDVTAAAGVAGSEQDWGTSCGWFDYDKDGLLDLFVCNYITWSKEDDLKLGSTLDGINRAYAPPRPFVGSFPTLFHNEGEGKFIDVSNAAGLQIREPNQQLPEPKSLGLTFHDFDEDGWLDVMVANDTTRNMLFRNKQNGTFEEVGQGFGIAYDRDGNARGAMGIDTANFRSSGSVGIVIGNFSTEPVSLFVADLGSTLFTDEATASGLGPQTRSALTFGMFFFDYDLDGRLDILTANGHLEEEISTLQRSQTYEQSPQLFWNAGEDQKTEFVAVPMKNVGEPFCKPLVGRGAAYADIDNDGDLDVVITACGQKPRLLRNDQQLKNNWLRIQLVAKDKNLDAIGAEITVRYENLVQTKSDEQTAGESKAARKLVTKKQSRSVIPTCSYMSQRELPVTFGLENAEVVQQIDILWPDGTTQSLKDVEPNQLLVVKQE